MKGILDIFDFVKKIDELNFLCKYLFIKYSVKMLLFFVHNFIKKLFIIF